MLSKSECACPGSQAARQPSPEALGVLGSLDALLLLTWGPAQTAAQAQKLFEVCNWILLDPGPEMCLQLIGKLVDLLNRKFSSEQSPNASDRNILRGSGW